MIHFDRLESLIKEQGRKKSYLCELAGKKRGYISDAQNGNGSISDEALEIFADALNTTVAYLRGETNEIQKEKPATDKGDGLTDKERELISILKQLPDEALDSIESFARVLLNNQ